MTDAGVTSFSNKRLRCGDWRSVAVLAGRGDPCLTVAIFRRGAVVSRFLVFARDLPVIENAINWTHAPDAERCDVGEFMAGTAIVKVFALARPGRPPAVCLGRVAPENGNFLGRATLLAGPELDALEAACRHLLKITRGEAASQEHAECSPRTDCQST